MSVHEIQAEELKQRFDQGAHMFVLDVRDEYEFEISNIGGHLIPLAELPKRLAEISAELHADDEIVAVCKYGSRSIKAAEYLQSHGFPRVVNLRGGIHAWADRIDHTVRKY